MTKVHNPKKALRKSVTPVLEEMECTIDACFYLKKRLSRTILTPPILCFGPFTADEIRDKNFPSIFADIRLGSDILEKDIVRPTYQCQSFEIKAIAWKSLSRPRHSIYKLKRGYYCMPKDSTTLIFCAHSDDEAVGMGGAIASFILKAKE